MMDRVTYAFGIGFAVAALLNALLVIVKERVPGVLASMDQLTGHHWMTHSLFAMAVFLVIGGVMLAVKPARAGTLTAAVAGATIVSSLLIAGWYFVA
jgi:hypothetical protein